MLAGGLGGVVEYRKHALAIDRLPQPHPPAEACMTRVHMRMPQALMKFSRKKW